MRISKLPQIGVFFFFFLFTSGIEFPENGSMQALHSNSQEKAITFSIKRQLGIPKNVNNQGHENRMLKFAELKKSSITSPCLILLKMLRSFLSKSAFDSLTANGFNISNNPACVQSVRWRRKPRWLPMAKSKLFKIPPRPVMPEEEKHEWLRLNNNYK